jgi:hypothetical protein
MYENDESMQSREDVSRRDIDAAWDEVKRALDDSRDTRDAWARDVSHPRHYMSEGVECIEAMYRLDPALAVYFSAGSALKYLDRAGLKDDKETDLNKAFECWHMAKRMMARGGDYGLR